MQCPKCNSQLRKKVIHEVEIDECKKCEGIWFDKDELRKIKDKTDSDLNWMDFEVLKHRDKFKLNVPKKNCPKCKIKMEVLNYDDSKVEIDFCTICNGIWLDKNEFESIIQFLEDEILTKLLGDYVKATIEEAKEILTGPESFISEWKDFSTILRFLQYRILVANPKIHNGLVKLQQNPFNK
jgi:Zn-finger nucleic acid-binding protein